MRANNFSISTTIDTEQDLCEAGMLDLGYFTVFEVLVRAFVKQESIEILLVWWDYRQLVGFKKEMLG